MQFIFPSSRDCFRSPGGSTPGSGCPSVPSQGSASLLADEGWSPLSQTLLSRACSRPGLALALQGLQQTRIGLLTGGTTFKMGRGTIPGETWSRAEAGSSSLPCSCRGDATEQGQARVLHLSIAGRAPSNSHFLN